MEGKPRTLVLIRARHLAESVLTPTFLADAEGNLIFFNEAAETILGRTYADTGALGPGKWQETFNVRTKDGSPFPLEDMPGWIALQQHKPSLGHLRFTTPEGTDRTVAVCAVPLFTKPGEFEGGLIIFWEES